MSHPRRSSRDVTWSHPLTALALLLRGRTAHVAAPVAAVVGTVLSSVNQGAIIVSGDATTATWVRVGVNYLVPFLVSSYGWLTARRVPAGATDTAGIAAGPHDVVTGPGRDRDVGRHRAVRGQDPIVWACRCSSSAQRRMSD